MASLVRAPGRPPEGVASAWLSHRTFVLNARKELTLAGLLATPGATRRIT